MPQPGTLESVVDLGALVARLEAVCATKVDVVERHDWEADTTLRWLDFKPTWDSFQRTREAAIRARMRRNG